MADFEIKFNTSALASLLHGPAGPVAAYLERVGFVVETGAKLALSRHGAVDNGRLRASITHKTEREGEDLVLYVGTNVEYAIYVHQGRRPGARMPPEAPILEWARRQGIITSTDSESAARGKAFVIRRAISRRGIPAKPFLAEALPLARTVT